MIIQTTKAMRPRDSHDHYPTPRGLIRVALDGVSATAGPYILDPGAGSGVWGEVARTLWPQAVIAGTDLRPLSRPACYDYWQTGVNFLRAQPTPEFDLVVGNPPYRHAEAFVRLGLAYLRPGGALVYLLRLAFLESQTRALGLWREFPPHRVRVCARRPSFSGDGRTDATAYAVYLWVAGSPSAPRPWHPAVMDWMQWSDEEPAP